jgi:RNA polymerase sigma-70 factor (ECF subfamily)
MSQWKTSGELFRSFLGRSDEQLMWRVKTEGDHEAFAGLVARWEKPVLSLCARITGDATGAEDITQAAFARVFANRQRWECVGKFSTWLWRIAINLCHDEARKPWRRECSLDAMLEAGSPDDAGISDMAPAPDVQAEAAERGELVRMALAKLDPRYREVIVLKHYENLKFHEIAEVLDIPVGTAKSRMAEGLGRLNKILKGLDPRCKTTETQTNSPGQ